ncbi:protein HEG isoform X5 [Sebastes umbrosus]|uniref:protein HEG isoform X5 n=1 Tax=Sebastes umbrosus TaxID=72105 RepID=UPI00189D0F29|nr:protein HEG isoform X5 [Sebastes umbrosus]
MFLSYLPVVFLLAAVVKGMTTTDSTTHNVTTNDTSTTPAIGNHSTTSFTTLPPSSEATATTENATAEYTTMTPSATHSETAFTQPSTEFLNTTAPVNGTVTENSNSTTSHPTDSPSAPTSGTMLTATTPTNTMTGHTTLTHSTKPAGGNTTASSTTATISPTTISTGTTQRPTDITTNNSTTAAPPIPPVIACPAVPCPLESVCLDGTCQCISGSFLVDGRCVPAQVFPGQLHITSLTFVNQMSNRSSEIFQSTAADISAALRDALKNQPGYKQSDVVRLESGSVQATVNNIFENTTATQESVDQAIKQAITSQQTGLLGNASFTSTDLCFQKPLPCDVFTTSCANTNGRVLCSCKEGYISMPYSNTSCRVCPSGQRAAGDKCQPCAFGYAGFNCNDSALLAVVVISCVLGGVLLIIVLALLAYCCWMRCSEGKPDYNSSPYSSGDANQPWPPGITPIPRASTNFDAAPPIEMTEGGSTRALVDKKQQNNGLGFQAKMKGGKKGSYDLNPEAMNTFTGKNPSRYSYLVQGHENPYFLPGDGSKN